MLGYAIVGPMLANPHWAELLGLSYAAGFGMLGIILFDLSLLEVVPDRRLLLLIAIAAIAMIGIWTQRGRLSCFIRGKWQWNFRFLLGVTGLVLIALAIANAAASLHTTGLYEVDEYAIWVFKAKLVAIQALHPIPAALLDPSLSYSHQDYPLGMPFTLAGMFAAIGSTNLLLAKYALLGAYIALAAVLYGALRRQIDMVFAAAITAVVIGAPVMMKHAGMAVAEVPLVLMHAACLVMLLRWMQCADRRALLGSGFFAACAAFTKNEGLALLPLWAVIVCIWAAIEPKARRPRAFLSFIIIIGALLIPWLIFRTFLPHTHEDYGSKLASPATLLGHLPRLREILLPYIALMWDYKTVGGIWLILLVVAVVHPGAFRRRMALLLWLMLLGHIGLYALTFMVTPWDTGILIPMVGPKLLMHATPLAAMLIGLHLHREDAVSS